MRIRLQKLVIPCILLIIIITLRISSSLNNETYYDEFKTEFKKDLDIISLSKKFLGKIQYVFFDEEDYFVSSNEEKFELEDGSYFVSTDAQFLISKNNGVCTSIIKEYDTYTITLRCEGVIITYYEVSTPIIKLYEFVSVGEEVCELHYNYSYYYKVNYED